MKRLSSAAGCRGCALNSTRVFRSQGRIPVLLGLLAVGVTVTLPTGCRRGTTQKPPEPSSSEGARPGDVLPTHGPPPAPPLLPVPEEVTTPDAVHRAQGLPDVHVGGALRVHLDGDPTHLNPLLDPDASALQIVSGLVYEPLIECPSPGTTGGYRPVLAESWQISPDGLRIALRLRSGVRWHDGRNFSGLDVQATLEPLLSAGGTDAVMLRSSLQDVASIEISADRIVRLLLKRPSDLALRALCDILILPDHLLRGPGADRGALLRQPVGTGPFRFAGWEKGKRIRLARNKAYWAESPPLDEIAFEVDPDGARALARTRRGDIDILPRVLPSHYPEEVDPVTLHGALGLWRMRTDRWAYVAVNHRHAPLGDARFRRALSALWDREHFARDLHRGLAHTIGAPPFANVAPPFAGRARAITELDAGGYRDTDADGVREFEGKPIRHTLLLASGGRTAAAEAHAFVFEARKAGLLIDLVSVDAATLLGRLRKHDFDLALMLWEGRPDEDPGTLFGTNGPFNFSGYRSIEVDAALDSLRRAAGPAERRPHLMSLGALLARDQPVLFLYQFDVPTLVASHVHGLAAVSDRLDLRRVWVDP